MTSIFFGKPVEIKKNTNLPFKMENSLKEVIYYASLAPNSHNAQMWHVTAYPDKKQLMIELDDKRSLENVDPKDREAYISIGAFLKNMETAFKAYGYNVNIETMDVENTNDIEKSNNIVAKVTYSGGSEEIVKPELLNLIEKRHTDKSKFDNSNLPEDIVNKLLEKSTDNIKYYPKDSEAGTYLAEGTLKAMDIQSSNQEKRDELADWLRFSDTETLAKKDGLSAEQLGISGVKKIFYYMFSNKESAKKDSFANQGVDMTKGQVNNCSGFIILTGDNNQKDLINTGMILEDFWLEAVSENVSVHPMSQMLEEEEYKNEISSKLNTDKPVQMILRVGKVKEYGENAKIRRDLSEFVTKGE